MAESKPPDIVITGGPKTETPSKEMYDAAREYYRRDTPAAEPDDILTRLLEKAEAAQDRRMGILSTPGITTTATTEPLTLEVFMQAVEKVSSQRLGGCYCTGECKSNPCHPCNGGIGGASRVQDGWRCPTCGRNYAPWVFQCPTCAPRVTPQPFTPKMDCGCGPNQVCMNTACPRRIVVTCES